MWKGIILIIISLYGFLIAYHMIKDLINKGDDE